MGGCASTPVAVTGSSGALPAATAACAADGRPSSAFSTAKSVTKGFCSSSDGGGSSGGTGGGKSSITSAAPVTSRAPSSCGPAAPCGGAPAGGTGGSSFTAGPLWRLSSVNRIALELELLGDVHGLQHQLALVNDNPLLGLQEAAEILALELGADLAAIWVVHKEDPDCSVLLVSHGRGSSELQRRIVVRAAPGAATAAQLGAAVELSIPDASAEQSGVIPEELWKGPAALKSFKQVPIGAGTSPRGTLLLASRQAGFFCGKRWQVRLQIASTGLLNFVRHAQVDQMAHLLKSMDETQDPVALISVLLRSASRYMLKACTMRASTRLALLQPGSPGQALLFEAPRALEAGPGQTRSCSVNGSLTSGLVSHMDAADGLVASQIDLTNTLMASAVSQQQARFVQDCGQYMQTCLQPARDVFTRSSELVSSIVVVPLIAGGDEPLGAIYFASELPCEFTNIQDILLGFIHGVTPMLHTKLRGRADELTEMMSETRSLAPAGGDTDTSHHYSGALDAPRSSASTTGILSRGPSRGPSSRRLSKVSSNRLNTEALLQVLQQDLRIKGRRLSSDGITTLSVGECLGRGGFGVVYRGRWHKVPVAAKIMPSHHNEREALQDAVEMAVLSSVQHPNIVSVYSCLTDMAEITESDSGGTIASEAVAAGASMHFRKLQPEEDPEGTVPTFNIVVMEYCDCGTLREAIQRHLFHRQLPGGAIGVDLGAAVEVLLDVAYAVQHLHSMQLVHGDIKLDNVLLKSDNSRNLGVTPKLSDFGLTKILNSEQGAVNVNGAGTVTHLPPELFVAGSRVTTAVDVYAFGILMWEVYTSRRAYAGLPRGAVMDRVFKQGMRPSFPRAAPAHYTSLAEACWHSDPSSRPTFAEVAERLEAIALEITPASDTGADI